MKLFFNILRNILIPFILFFGVLIMSSGFYFNTFQRVYIYLVLFSLFIGLLFIIMSIIQICSTLKPKTKITLFIISFTIIVFSVAGLKLNKAYHSKFEEIAEKEVELNLYNPFKENTLTVTLNEPSKLHLSEQPPKLDGATALYPLYAAFAKAVYSENFSNYIVSSGTDEAYRRLINGYTDIIFVASPSEEQLKFAKDAGVELTFTPIGLEAFVFFVNTNNPVSNLSTEDIKKIYSGESKNWKEFGGRYTRIRAFQRPLNSGSQTALLNFMGDTPLMTPPEDDVINGMGGIIKQVSSYKNYNNAIGFSFLFFAEEMFYNNKIKLLSVNGVEPTKENVANKTYPHASEFYAVTAGTTNPHIETFLGWILSEQGQYLVDKSGYTSIKEF